MSTIKIIEYEKWMKKKVISLFVEEYNVLFKEFEEQFENLYDDNFQKNKCIRVVAFYNDDVVGFQSFFYWPYKINNSNLNSFQSGNSIVATKHRGMGVFGLMLGKIEVIAKQKEIDFLIGFPVKQSLGSFIRKKWINSFNILWHVRPISYNPFIFFKSTNKLVEIFNANKKHYDLKNEGFITLENSNLFIKYRKKLSADNFYHIYEKNGVTIEFCMKVIIRKRVLKELVIGRVDFNLFENEIINEGFIDLIKKIKKTKRINFISIALSENTKVFNEILLKNNFKKINNKIFFIHKNFKPVILNDILIFRSDLDTW